MTLESTTSQEEMQRWVPETGTLLLGAQMVDPQRETWHVDSLATEDLSATRGGASIAHRGEPVARSRAPLRKGAGLSSEERSRHIHKLADALEAAADRLLPSIVNEVGTPVALAEYLQVRMAVDEHLRWAAEAAKDDRTLHLGEYDKPHPTKSDVAHDPVGENGRA